MYCRHPARLNCHGPMTRWLPWPRLRGAADAHESRFLVGGAVCGGGSAGVVDGSKRCHRCTLLSATVPGGHVFRTWCWVACWRFLYWFIWRCVPSVAALRSLPQQAKRWRALQRERAVYTGLMDALANQLAGRYVRARSAAKSAIDHVSPLLQSGQVNGAHIQSFVLAHLLAAEDSARLARSRVSGRPF